MIVSSASWWIGSRYTDTVFDHLLIHDRRERALVGVTDLLLSVIAPIVRRWSSRPEPAAPRRILLLRLERIGDFLMTLGAIAMVRARAPHAEIDLVVGEPYRDLRRAN